MRFGFLQLCACEEHELLNKPGQAMTVKGRRQDDPVKAQQQSTARNFVIADCQLPIGDFYLGFVSRLISIKNINWQSAIGNWQ